MFRVAILGCENSHADSFLNYMNRSGKFSDVEIVGAYSDEPEACARMRDNFGLYVAKRYDEFVGKIDGLIITARHGDNHYKYAKPYIASGIPMFIDKPITVSENEAVTFMNELAANNVRVTGGSCCMHDTVIQRLKEIAAQKPHGEILGGYFRAPLSVHNAYGGFFFYAQHLVQMVSEVFGYYPDSVKMYQNDTSYTAVIRYPQYIVTAEYKDDNQVYYAAVSCEKAVVGEACTLRGCFETEFDEFYNLLQGGAQKQTYDAFIAPVFVMNAMYRSLESGNEERVHRAKETV
ncbi:MAG: Gfo/Idh/MocA family oxidoreductase [Clostridia bacterium]|nr:Gfo/Idh/MocA family oxidoreductase [Clostridia bacterium]